MALSEGKIRTAKSSAKIRKLSDGGLQLWVTPAGGKHWKLAYRYGRPAKQRLLPLGAYPAVDLPRRDAPASKLAYCSRRASIPLSEGMPTKTLKRALPFARSTP
jgi:hypothetical protein